MVVSVNGLYQVKWLTRGAPLTTLVRVFDAPNVDVSYAILVDGTVRYSPSTISYEVLSGPGLRGTEILVALMPRRWFSVNLNASWSGTEQYDGTEVRAYLVEGSV